MRTCNDRQSRAARGVAGAMLFYNVAALVLLAYALSGLNVDGVGLRPSVVLHAALAGWCVCSLRSKWFPPRTAEMNPGLLKAEGELRLESLNHSNLTNHKSKP